MCGIVGYVGSREVSNVMVDALRRLEYREYDSYAVALMEGGTLRLVRAAGNVAALEHKLGGTPSNNLVTACERDSVRVGIGRTNWIRRESAAVDNIHLHRDCSGRFVVVLNGTVENDGTLRRQLEARGHGFDAEATGDALPHLIEGYFDGDLESAVRRALREIEGELAVLAISSLDGRGIVAAARNAPLIVGVGSGENFVASDVSVLLPFSRQLLYLNDGDVARLSKDRVDIMDARGVHAFRRAEGMSCSTETAEKDGFPHFMIKEIHEQPRAVRDVLAGRVDDHGKVTLAAEIPAFDFRRTPQVHLVASGAALHAAMIGRFFIESFARITVHVDCSSEFLYSHPIVQHDDVVIGVVPSADTAHTMAAMRQARQRGAATLAISNVPDRAAMGEWDGAIMTQTTQEVGIASTKAFTAQLTAFFVLALHMAGERGTLSACEVARRGRQLRELPARIEQTLELNEMAATLAGRFANHPSFLYLGGGIEYPVAMEGALELRELSCVHAEACNVEQIQHGLRMRVDSGMPVLALAPRDRMYQRAVANMTDIRARNGIVIAIASDGDVDIVGNADHALFIPEVDELLSPILSATALQLFAYHAAVRRGCQVDHPGNLARSVAVE
jgi:glucosamine--fructose-6-phosphate aminotransferase (isomerizing)